MMVMTKRQKGRLFKVLKPLKASVDEKKNETFSIPKDSLCLMLKLIRKDKQESFGFFGRERTIPTYRIKLLVGEKIVWVEVLKCVFHNYLNPVTPQRRRAENNDYDQNPRK